MSPTRTASDRPARRPRRPRAPKWLVVAHRWLGIAVGLLMLLWFASGVVMLYVPWPEVTEAERAAALPPVDWRDCCAFDALADVREVDRASVEDVAGRPVLRLSSREIVDLTTGAALAPLTRGEAAAVAEAFGRARAIAGLPARIDLVERDQWTVTGYFDAHRPFWRVRFDDRRASEVYVSASNGRVAQATDRPARVLAWLGPIPHWLYPSVLRHNAALWTQVVIWTSLAGTFLTVTGLYLGIIAWRPWRDRRLTPYRGIIAWHHFTGLAAGLLTLAWAASGLFSMQPWGFLESGPDDAPARMAGAVAAMDLRRAVEAAAARELLVRQLRLAPLGGRLGLVAEGTRLGPDARPAPLSDAELARAAQALGPIARQGLMTGEDAYWYSHHQPVRLPVWRVVRADGVRFYLDPGTGELLKRVDGAAKGFRWLHLGLHRLDVIPGFGGGPAWAAVLTVLLLASGSGVAVGVWLGFRRLRSDCLSYASNIRRRVRRG